MQGPADLQGLESLATQKPGREVGHLQFERLPSHGKWQAAPQQRPVPLPALQPAQVVAVLAPKGTTLTVPDPDDGIDATGSRRYRCGGAGGFASCGAAIPDLR